MVERRVAVVTGGCVGVGRATVDLLAEDGFDVAVVARGDAGVQAAVSEVESRGGRGLAVEIDVADHDAVMEAAARIEHDLGPIDAWINTAFVGTLAFAWDTTMDEYRRVMDVTFVGQVHGTLGALSVMRPRNRGVIVNVGSAMAYRSIPLQAPYCAAKHAVKGFTESVMTELAHEKSKVELCMVQLPGLNTPQFEWNLNKMPDHPMPVPQIYQPELAAKGIVHLVDHPRRNLWVGLPTAMTILGERLAPKLLRPLSGAQRGQIPAVRSGCSASRPQPDRGARRGRRRRGPRALRLQGPRARPGAVGGYAPSASRRRPDGNSGQRRRAVAKLEGGAMTGGVQAVSMSIGQFR